MHLAVAALLVLGKRTETIDAAQDSAIMVSVIDAPAPRQAQPQSPAPVTPPQPSVEKVAEPESQPRVDPTPDLTPEPLPQPVEQPSPLAPVIKPRPKPQPKPQRPVPHAAPVSPAPVAAPAPQADVASDSQAQQASQTPRQDQPVLVTRVEYDGARPMPVYPRLSRMQGEAGRVVVLVRISPRGGVEEARIETSSGYARLDDAALDAARRARFKPFTRNGVAMAALAKLPFDFQMRNSQ